MLYDTIPCYPYHIIYHNIPFNNIPQHNIPHDNIPYYTLLYHTLPYHSVFYIRYFLTSGIDSGFFPNASSRKAHSCSKALGCFECKKFNARTKIGSISDAILNLKFWIHSSLVLDEHRMDWVEYAILSGFSLVSIYQTDVTSFDRFLKLFLFGFFC